MEIVLLTVRMIPLLIILNEWTYTVNKPVCKKSEILVNSLSFAQII